MIGFTCVFDTLLIVPISSVYSYGPQVRMRPGPRVGPLVGSCGGRIGLARWGAGGGAAWYMANPSSPRFLHESLPLVGDRIADSNSEIAEVTEGWNRTDFEIVREVIL